MDNRDLAAFDKRQRNVKRPTKTDIVPGKLVAFNTMPNATWFEVVEIDGFCIVVREPGFTDLQRSDISLVKQVKAEEQGQ